ncbi:MAG: SBBP repeat-containing protein, partial [Bacteroidia bacterium]
MPVALIRFGYENPAAADWFMMSSYAGLNFVWGESETIKNNNMKKIYLFMALNLTFIVAQAQYFQWAKREGLYAYDYGYGIGTDANGNVYVAGKYEQAANFSGVILPCAANNCNHEIYVAQYSPNGNLNWIHTGGGTLGDYAHAMTLDKTNYVYVAGEVEGFNNVITFPGSTFTLTTYGDNDIFVSKYDLTGNLLWVKSMGWTKSEKALGVAYDNSGNVYICGYFTDTTRFGGPSTALTPGKGDLDIFIAKFDASGTLQWAQTAGSPGRDEALSIKCDGNGDIYICGMMSNNCMFGATTLTCTGNYLEAFVAKYSPSGSKIAVNAKCEQGDVIVSISDQGVGITPDERQNL